MKKLYKVILDLIENYKNVGDKEGLRRLRISVEDLHYRGKLIDEEYEELMNLLSDV